MKHELYASGRVMLPLSGILLALAGMVLLMERTVKDSGVYVTFSFGILILLFVVGCIAICVMAVLTMIRRFYKTMLTDQGYLTNTLPVSVHSLILSKLLTALLYFLLTAAVMLLATGIATEFYGVYDTIQRVVNELLRLLSDKLDWSEIRGYLVYSVFLGITTILCLCLRCYSAMAMGHSFANHKGLLSFVFFIVLGIVERQISVGVFSALMNLHMDSADSFFYAFYHLMFGPELGVKAVFLLVYYFITAYFISKKLNLA